MENGASSIIKSQSMTSEKDNPRRSYATVDMPDDHRRMIEEAAALDDELEKLRALVQFIASDYHELSAEKAMWRRDDWKKRCRALLKKYKPTTPADMTLYAPRLWPA